MVSGPPRSCKLRDAPPVSGYFDAAPTVRSELSPNEQSCPTASSTNCFRRWGGSSGDLWTSTARPGSMPISSNKSAPHGCDFRTIVALGKVALAFGASHHAKPPPAALQGMHQILRVNLAATGDFMHHHGPVVVPLPRQCPRLRNAVGADTHQHVRTHRLRHETAQRKELFVRMEPGADAGCLPESQFELALSQGRNVHYTPRVILSIEKIRNTYYK